MKSVELKNYLKVLKDIMAEYKVYLIELDSVVGDGDLGLTMSDGFLAAYNAIADDEERDLGKLLYKAGKAMSVAVPSTMGTLMASGFMQAGKELRGNIELQDREAYRLFQEYETGVANRGKAKVGEKTFLDGIAPAVNAMIQSGQRGESIKEIAKKGAEAAKTGFENTTTMKAIHGRAATRGEESVRLKDPGAAVAMLMFEAFEMSLVEVSGK